MVNIQSSVGDATKRQAGVLANMRNYSHPISLSGWGHRVNVWSNLNGPTFTALRCTFRALSAPLEESAYNKSLIVLLEVWNESVST